MDAGLAWTVVGSVAGVAAVGIGAVQVRQARRESRRNGTAGLASELADGLTAAPAGAGGLAGPDVLPGAGALAAVSGGQGVLVGMGNVQVNVLQPADVRPPAEHGPPRLVVGEIPQQPPGYQLRSGLLAALDPPSRVVVVRAVTGMRGVGKTQL